MGRNELSVHRIWWSLRRGREQLVDPTGDVPLRFGLRLAVRNMSLSSTETLKRLVDGAIAAFHAHDGTELQVCTSRLAKSLDQDESLVSSGLMESGQACLGVRRLLWPRKDGVQWNPADDQCVAAEVTTLPPDGASDVQVSAEIVTLLEAPLD